MGIPLNIQRVADMTGRTRRQVERWQDEGLRFTKQGRENIVDSEAFLAWYVKKFAGSTVRNFEESRLKRAQAERAELEIAERRGDLVSLSTIRAEWDSMLTTARQRLLNVAQRVAPIFGDQATRVRVEVDSEIRSALESLADYDGRTGTDD